MPSTIKKRGNLWYYDSNTQRNRQRISLKTSNHRVALRAKRILDERRAKKRMWESTAFAQPLEGVIDGYLTWSAATKSPDWTAREGMILRHFQGWWNGRRLDHKTVRKYIHDIVATDIEQFLFYRRNQGVSTETMRKELFVLGRLWRRAVRDGGADRNVVDGITVPRNKPPKETRPFTAKEVQSILDAQRDTPRYPVFATLYYTGLRVGDVISMQANEFNLDEGTWERRIGKTGKVMRMPLAKPLISILQECLPLKGPAFPAFCPGPTQRSEASRINLLRNLKRTLARLKLQDGNLISFRHAFNQRLMEMGLNIEDRQVLMGHSASRTTKIYTHGNEDLARTYLDKL